MLDVLQQILQNPVTIIVGKILLVIVPLYWPLIGIR